jgi:hypothetical protein
MLTRLNGKSCRQLCLKNSLQVGSKSTTLGSGFTPPCLVILYPKVENEGASPVEVMQLFLNQILRTVLAGGASLVENISTRIPIFVTVPLWMYP